MLQMRKVPYMFTPAFVLLVFVLFGCVADCAYTLNRATSALYFCKASYCTIEGISHWNCEACVNTPPFHVKQVYENSSFGTQAYSGVSGDTIVVAFRGSINIPNWIENMEFTHVTYPNADCSGCTVHRGFFNSYLSVRPQLLRDVQELVAACARCPILVAGHSLGGAMAALAAADLAAQPHPGGSAPHIELYTFGSPRVGNQAFADWFARQLCMGGHESYAVTHKRDIVPHLPPSMFGFVRSPQEIWYPEGNTDVWKICNNSAKTDCPEVKVREDQTCSNSIYSSSVLDHLIYLGHSTLCLWTTESVASVENVPLNAKTKMVLASEYVYQRFRSGFSSHTPLNAV